MSAPPVTFIDEATISIKAGDGGNGIAAFLREKYRPKGGPAGGDGGNGGDVYLKVAPGILTLQDFRHQRHFKAERGQDGCGRNMHGRAGKDLTIPVPPGTMVFDAESGTLIADLAARGARVLVAKGGVGGQGNQHFATPSNRAPTKQIDGTPGEERGLRLELRLLADVGLVGFPNAGKSTFLNRVSNAKPRIASYPFTTLRPSVGIVRVGDFHAFTMADIPGIIEDAHAGKGLGLQFLRHIARTRILCHLIPLREDSAEDLQPLIHEYKVILSELEAYGDGLIDRRRVTVLNKRDALLDPDSADRIVEEFRAATGCPTPIYCTSTQGGEGLVELVIDLMAMVLEGGEDPHAGLEIRYTLPAAHLNIREVTYDTAHPEALTPAELEVAWAAEDPAGEIETTGGDVVKLAGERKP